MFHRETEKITPDLSNTFITSPLTDTKLSFKLNTKICMAHQVYHRNLISVYSNYGYMSVAEKK